MLIKSSSTLRNDYDTTAKLAKEQPVYITRNGEGEMVFVSQELYEKREMDLTLLEKLLATERNRLAGAPTYSLDEIEADLEAVYAEV